MKACWIDWPIASIFLCPELPPEAVLHEQSRRPILISRGHVIHAVFIVGQRQSWWKPSVFATRSVSEGLYLTRPLAYASGYYFGKSGAVQIGKRRFCTPGQRGAIQADTLNGIARRIRTAAGLVWPVGKLG